MKQYKWTIILLNLVLLLVYFTYSITKKEDLLKNGQLILLELAPVDPRSLMQGDYMALRYKIAQDFQADRSKSIQKRGYCVVKIDVNGIAQKVRLQQELKPLNKNEYLIAYTSSNSWNTNIGAESFFFQEGLSKKYEKAKYGGIKIDESGNSLLIGLYDEQRNFLQ